MNETITFKNIDGDTVELEVSPELIRDLGQDLKTRLNALYREMAELAYIAQAVNDCGGLASSLTCSKPEIETWAKVYETWPGAHVITKTARHDARWYQAILDTGDPQKWYDEAMKQELGPTQIRKRAGVVKSPANGKMRVQFSLTEWKNGLIRGYAPLDTEPPSPLPEKAILEVQAE